jgi:hypothetical protein
MTPLLIQGIQLKLLIRQQDGNGRGLLGTKMVGSGRHRRTSAADFEIPAPVAAISSGISNRKAALDS